MNKKILTLIVLLLALGGVILWYTKLPKKEVKAPEVKETTLEQPLPKPVEHSKLPEKFIAGFLLEENVTVTDNYNSETDKIFQATRQYVSKKSLAENYKLFENYLNSNSWKIVSRAQNEQYRILSAEKDGTMVTVSMTANALEKQNIVDITFTYAK
ncbi:MAG: hypothetical protein JNN11_03075 [Candidatus Doudnabacteria bacterium]|nr:hypothetical protein [Candidatus Doudnabacteria bacterium]